MVKIKRGMSDTTTLFEQTRNRDFTRCTLCSLSHAMSHLFLARPYADRTYNHEPHVWLRLAGIKWLLQGYPVGMCISLLKTIFSILYKYSQVIYYQDHSQMKTMGDSINNAFWIFVFRIQNICILENTWVVCCYSKHASRWPMDWMIPFPPACLWYPKSPRRGCQLMSSAPTEVSKHDDPMIGEILLHWLGIWTSFLYLSSNI